MKITDRVKQLAKKYDMNFDTLKRYRNDPKKLESKIIEKLVIEKEVTLQQFLTLFDSSIKSRLEEIAKEPYSSILPLKLAILEYENESSLFIDDELFENRAKIKEMRDSWWEPDSSIEFRRVDDEVWFLIDASSVTEEQKETIKDILELNVQECQDFDNGRRWEILIKKEEIEPLLNIF